MSDEARTFTRADPHWVVVCMSRDRRESPVEIKDQWRRLKLHWTATAAGAECERLAQKFPGWRFAVYASGVSCKIEKPVAEAEEAT